MNREKKVTNWLTPEAQGYNVDSRYVMYISGTAQSIGINAIPINAYKFPAALTVGSIPNGPPWTILT
jgi:hypothetical protein